MDRFLPDKDTSAYYTSQNVYYAKIGGAFFLIFFVLFIIYKIISGGKKSAKAQQLSQGDERLGRLLNRRNTYTNIMAPEEITLLNQEINQLLLVGGSNRQKMYKCLICGLIIAVFACCLYYLIYRELYQKNREIEAFVCLMGSILLAYYLACTLCRYV